MQKKNFTSTLIISTYNSPKFLKRVLHSLALQTVKPTQIIIADDGSTDETRQEILSFQRENNLPLTHVWHEDLGNRKTVILNKSLAVATGDYIIEIDGDIVMERHFIEDHLRFARRGFYATGSRVLLTENGTLSVIFNPEKKIKIGDFKFDRIFNKIRIPLITNLLAENYKKSPLITKGCNFAAWREDLLAVNGWNEDMLEWGFEDSELAVRLHHNGLKKRYLKLAAVCFHLHHPISSRVNENKNFALQMANFENGVKRCENGVDKYF